jgi:phospholipase C
MAYALDLVNAARTDAPAIAVTQGTFGTACTLAGAVGLPGIGTIDKGQANGAASAKSMATSDAGGRFADLRTKATALGFPAPP